MSFSRFILGSRSPRRLELLAKIVPKERIAVLPPQSAQEVGFEDLHDWPGIEQHLSEIVHAKCDNVLGQIVSNDTKTQRETEHESSPVFSVSAAPLAEDIAAVITADTVIVVTAENGLLKVLGQPPDDNSWPATVRRWFLDYYAGQTHVAATGLCVATSLGHRVGRVVRSEVTFHAEIDHLIDWYIASEEPRGKAGGYAIQGVGEVFVSRVEGSLSNVIGLPLRDLLEVFEELRIDDC